MKVMYENEVVEAEVKGNSVYVFDEAICEEVRIGSVEQCEEEFLEIN